MSIENIVQTVMTSKKYSNIIPETINRICNEESIKYKKDKDILRSSKKRLHIISESFLSIANANKIASIKKCIDNDGHISTEMIEQLLLLHISTKERSSFYKEFYNDIFRVVGNVNSILDIACGLNPVAYVLSDNFDSRVRYEATDINLDNIATVYKGNIIKNLIMDCQSYAKYRPNETTGGIFVSWRRKEELPTGA